MYRIADKYSKVNLNESTLILLSEAGGDVLHSTLAVDLLNKISESSITKEELLKEFTNFVDIQNGLLTLHQLEESGYITTNSVIFTVEQSAYWESIGYDISKLASVLKNKSIGVKSISKLDVSDVEKVCVTAGIQIADSPDIIVVIADDYLQTELEEFNYKAIKNNQDWLLVKLNGTKPLIGPLFTPNNNTSVCWKCLENRLLLHDQENRLYKAIKKTNTSLTRPLTSHPLSRQITANFLVLEIIAYLYHGNNIKLENQLLSINTVLGEQNKHIVVKRPQCSVCGDKNLMQKYPKPIQLQKAIVANTVHGGYRTVKAITTFNKYKHHVSSITGIVPYLREYQSIDGAPIYNYGSGKNLALQSTSMFWLNMHLRSANGGKGRTKIQAKTGALCEAIERYSLMYHDKTYTIRTSLNELENAIHPNICMLYSEAQFRNRNYNNAQNTKFYSLIPLDFDSNKTVDWSPVYSLTEEKFKYLPSEYCFAQYPAEDEKNLYAYPDSNGCAAGNTIEEAILQGYLELIERDAAAIWWYNRIQRPQVDLKSANNPFINEMMDYYEKLERSLYVLDLTTDLNIPVFVAISHCKKNANKDEVIYAFGAHVDVHIALERAIIELNQILPIVVKKKGEYLTKDPVFVAWLNNARLKEEPYLVPLTIKEKNIATDYSELCEATIFDSVQYCIEITKKHGLETLVLDLTQPDVGLPVVKVIVPGLRHFWRRTAPGRLYDVPVIMGWISKKYQEDELNPLSIFI